MDRKVHNQVSFIDQQRARKALEFAKVGNEKAAAQYRTVVLRFPMMIKVNGLAYSLAFAYSKREASYKLLYDQLFEWLQIEPQRLLPFKKKPQYRETEFIENLLDLNVDELLWATQEVMKLLDWMKRFVGEEKNSP